VLGRQYDPEVETVLLGQSLAQKAFDVAVATAAVGGGGMYIYIYIYIYIYTYIYTVMSCC
jgi:hypothetical protein